MFRAGHLARGLIRSPNSACSACPPRDWRSELLPVRRNINLLDSTNSLYFWNGSGGVVPLNLLRQCRQAALPSSSPRRTTRRVLYSAVKFLKALKWKYHMAYLFLRSFGLYLYIATKYDMSFPFEQGRGTRRWTTSAFGLERDREPRFITLHGCIFARNSARIHHGRCWNTARRFTAKASRGYNVPMSVRT